MRWGERRYQYKDGSLTPEGRRHYGYGEERNKLRSEIKIVREKARAERKMAAVKAREDRKMAKVQNAERIKYEKQRQRLEAKIQKTKNADKLKAEKSKERQAARDARDQKRQIAEFKKKHPLQYQKIKPYLTKNGTLNDEGQTIFFGNGQKKTLAKMSNEDIRNATYRMNLKNRLNEQVATYNAHDPAAQRKATAKAVVGAGVISFVASFGLQSAADLVSGGTNEVKANLRNNGKKAAMAAIGAIGTTLTARLHLSGNKGKQAYNAFRVNGGENNTSGNKHGKRNASNSNHNQNNTNASNSSSSSNSNSRQNTSSSGGSSRWRSRGRSSSSNSRSQSSSTSNSGPNMRRASHAGSRFVNTFNSIYGNRRASTPTSSQTSRADAIISTASNLPYSEIAGYLTSGQLANRNS
jgi:hypothetical protein